MKDSMKSILIIGYYANWSGSHHSNNQSAGCVHSRHGWVRTCSGRDRGRAEAKRHLHHGPRKGSTGTAERPPPEVQLLGEQHSFSKAASQEAGGARGAEWC